MAFLKMLNKTSQKTNNAFILKIYYKCFFTILNKYNKIIINGMK